MQPSVKLATCRLVLALLLGSHKNGELASPPARTAQPQQFSFLEGGQQFGFPVADTGDGGLRAEQNKKGGTRGREAVAVYTGEKVVKWVPFPKSLL